jgi:hypothetical protein
LTLDLVIDETLERRWGSKIRKRGHYRDSAPSSKERSVSSPGLRWIVLAVVVTVPWTKQRWALPFLCVLATTPEISERLGKRHKTIGMWAHQMLSLVRRWLPDRCIKLIGDTAYSILELGLPRDAQRDASNESIGFTGCLPALARRLAATFTGVQDHHDPALKTSPEPLHVRVNLVAHPVGHLDPTIRAKIAHLPQYDVAALNVDANTIMSPIGQ